MLAAIIGSVAALLIGGATWQFLSLRSAVANAHTAVEATRSTAISAIDDTARITGSKISAEAADTLRRIHDASDKATKSTKAAESVANAQSASIALQARTLREDSQNQAAAVTKDVTAARQQIQAASELQPQIETLQKNLSVAQAQIQEQQKIIISSEDLAKKIFSSHKQFRFDIKTANKSTYAIIPFGSNQDGVELIALAFLIPSAPVEETLVLQFNQTPSAPDSVFPSHNAIIILIQKPAQSELLGKPITVSYFPDPSDHDLYTTLSVKDGNIFADGKLLQTAAPPSSKTTPTNLPKDP